MTDNAECWENIEQPKFSNAIGDPTTLGKYVTVFL